MTPRPTHCSECGAVLNGSEDFEDVCMSCDNLGDPFDDFEDMA